MNTASLEHCKELYELSGWEDTEKLHCLTCGDITQQGAKINDGRTHESVPAYTLGYLLRKLPEVRVLQMPDNGWNVYTGAEPMADVYADTPEDAACKLAIELFKAGILKKEVN